MKRRSWFTSPDRRAIQREPLRAAVRRALKTLDEMLFGVWNYGSNLVLAWTRQGNQLCFLAVRHYAIYEALGANLGTAQALDGKTFVNQLLAGPKCLAPNEFDQVCAVLGDAARVLEAAVGPEAELSATLVDNIVARYGVSLESQRAVMLLDVVGFSRRKPLDQLAMLNSLNHSVNSASRQLEARNVQMDFARTTTGDGFYLWNRAKGAESNVALYELLMLILADNAVAHRKAQHFPVPKLRAAFHVGEHYEFYQFDPLDPVATDYIVGQVTIELSRLVENALPGQILLGEFKAEILGDDASNTYTVDTPGFVERAAVRLKRLEGFSVAHEHVDTVRCYLTGQRTGNGDFLVDRYEIRDKHGGVRPAYNAKINIHLRSERPIFLGLQHKELQGFTAWR